MGTPAFAVPSLQKLIESHHEVLAVVTQPDRPVGRGQKLQMPPVKELALSHSIPVLQPEKIRKSGFEDILRPYAPDAIVVVAYGKIIPPSILSLPKFGCLNVHASLLPKYRGAAPIQWAIINGERETGITIMLLDEGMDTGNTIAAERIDILDDDDTHSVSNMLSVLGADLMLRVLEQIEQSGRVDSTPQDHQNATMAPLMKKSDGLLDWALANEQIICRIRGLQPWPTAFSFLHGRAWKFLNAEPFDDPGFVQLPIPEPSPTGKEAPPPDPGTVTGLIKGRGFTVKTGDGNLLVTQLQPADRKPVAGIDAMNGKLVKLGEEFISDPAFLEGTPDVR